MIMLCNSYKKIMWKLAVISQPAENREMMNPSLIYHSDNTFTDIGISISFDIHQMVPIATICKTMSDVWIWSSARVQHFQWYC